MVEIVREPWTEHRSEVHAVEIPASTPMKGMFQVADKLWKELAKFLAIGPIEEAGSSYLRFRVIDMEGVMQIRVGVPIKAPVAGNERNGDAFRNRRETVLTDRRLQPLKKQWTMELSIKLKDRISPGTDAKNE